MNKLASADSSNFDSPAIVIGGGLNALGVVRSLGAAGVPVMVVDHDARSPAMRSRFGRKLVCPCLEGQELMDFLKALATQLPQRAVLFATEEKTVVTLSELREQLPHQLLLRQPSHERLMALMHKQGFQHLAEAVHAPVPRTVRLEGLQDLEAARGLKYPVVLKPSEKNYEYGARFKKAYKLLSYEEVERQYREILPVLADMVVQEWIEGEDSDIYFCLQYVGEDGKPVASFAGRKIRSWPPRIGGTASCTAAWEEAEALEEATSLFFRQVGFTGMGSMEFKKDARDQRFYMVEPTVARTDFQEEVATLNGVNLPVAAYCYELGLSLPAIQKPDTPKVWSEPQIDRWSFEESGGKIDERSATLPVYSAYWRWNDPMPWLDSMLGRVLLKLRLKS
jgi:predicted ATP-grasp superfamily ATP-dependent carboligase